MYIHILCMCICLLLGIDPMADLYCIKGLGKHNIHKI